MKSIKLAVFLVFFNCVPKDAPTITLVNQTNIPVIFGIQTNLPTCQILTKRIESNGQALINLENINQNNTLIYPDNSIISQCPNNCGTCGQSTRITCVFAQDAIYGTILASSVYQYQSPEISGFSFAAHAQTAQIGFCPVPVGQTTPNLTDKYSGVDNARIVLSPFGSSMGVSSVPSTPASHQTSILDQGSKHVYGSQTYYLTSTSY